MRVGIIAALLAVAGCGARSGLRTPDVSIATLDASDTFENRDGIDLVDARELRDAIDVRDAPDTITVDVVGSAPCDLPANADFPPGATICDAMIHVGPISRSSSTCFIDQMVENSTGTLRFECNGGFAEARFGSERFIGSVRGGELWVCTSTDFVFTDGCHWRSAQEIRGTVARRTYLFSYSETHAMDETVCAASCSASAIVTTR